MIPWSAVLFDFDGTVADTATDVWNSVRWGFESEGLVLPASFSADNRNLAMLVEDMVALLYPESTLQQRTRTEQAVTHHYRYISTYADTVLYEGMEELLQALKARGIPTGILSNKGHYSLERILETKGWRQYFDRWRGTSSADDSTINKEKRLGLFIQGFDMSRGVYVGDSVGDVEAAKVNGVFSVGVLYGDGDGDLVRQALPDVVCATPGELKEYLIEG